MGRRPQLGDVVHYQSFGTPGREYEPACRTALVTEVGAWITTGTDDHGDGTRTLTQTWHREACALTIHNPTGHFLKQDVPHSEGARSGGTWHWPEDLPNQVAVRVDAKAVEDVVKAALHRLAAAGRYRR